MTGLNRENVNEDIKRRIEAGLIDGMNLKISYRYSRYMKHHLQLFGGDKSSEPELHHVKSLKTLGKVGIIIMIFINV